ncbi:tRNA (adenosine(37)-N6)-dimethylallyltransferase MiaA [Streptococcus chenjunshii]|uniref:tRNA dimethylallyltransferase n=1 Tax=Streptococcus chenjunshii TaxID=2173853 RepID=A0A372KLD6_9STRE|nr:tRNA (adenosine(37)-N6)-dimethylallyltransferase MiaA [Streptococcus chenjunshii]AXQ78395.1 tRNA (adenosine(37)-N6)-dimethylallyltransferase MiaA [Streptococcus chenjunshii]RFU50536.1 tRNA (adenosine(37)-N6)-dimethylallyltransferase MiaA [Streptococcus chenjunshii]RFU52796.1 tRNA (adenosine(37)-N6)-dimethylallyltransferase MiaA [Streptococcus chenjunshii]
MVQKLLVLVGPTAVGKTALGIELAQKFKGEIISGDSQQVYRRLDIGTAKATPEEQALVPHHLLDVRDITQTYSAYDFVQEAQTAVKEIAERGKVPLIVGGTGLYIQSFLEGYHLGGQLNQKDVLAYRQELESLSDAALFEKAAALKPDIPQPNRRRLIRALELAQFSQGELSNHQVDYRPLLIGLNTERTELYRRIDQRVDSMLQQGLLTEAKWLYDNYPHVQASRAIAYKEFFPYFAGTESLEQAVSKLKQNSRRFAKRQLTWFRNRMQVPFFDIADSEIKFKINQIVTDFLES